MTQLLNDAEYAHRSDLFKLLGDHTIPYSPLSTSNDLLNTVWYHLAAGSCYSDDQELLVGCKYVLSHFPPTYRDSITIGTSIIALAEQFCNIRVLKRIMMLRNISFSRSDKMEDIQKKLSTHIASTDIGRRVLFDVQ